MNVTFAFFGDDIASSRLRSAITQKELKKIGIEQGNDILVYGKHFLSFDRISGFGKYIYDVCDNHFETPDLRDYYYLHTIQADRVTCNSEVMRQIIKKKTGKDAIVIPEPYESKEREPEIGEMLYWFGHISNTKDLERMMAELTPEQKENLYILTNPKWTMGIHNKIMKNPLITVIPTGKSMAKSENRMVESIRQGRYVCAEYLPSYEPFAQFFPLGDIPSHVDWALSHKEEALEKIKLAQDYIRDRYAPATIAKQWLEVLHGINHTR